MIRPPALGTVVASPRRAPEFDVVKSVKWNGVHPIEIQIRRDEGEWAKIGELEKFGKAVAQAAKASGRVMRFLDRVTREVIFSTDLAGRTMERELVARELDVPLEVKPKKIKRLFLSKSLDPHLVAQIELPAPSHRRMLVDLEVNDWKPSRISSFAKPVGTRRRFASS